jgi:hypothetical protein
MIKNYLILFSALCVSACSATPETPVSSLIVEEKIHALSRAEVINAIEECHSVKLRPVMFYTQRLINQKQVPVVIDVTCAPVGNYQS